MAELTDRDAIDLIIKYCGQRFKPQDALKLVEALSKVDIIGLVIYTFKAGVTNERAN